VLPRLREISRLNDVLRLTVRWQIMLLRRGRPLFRLQSFMAIVHAVLIRSNVLSAVLRSSQRLEHTYLQKETPLGRMWNVTSRVHSRQRAITRERSVHDDTPLILTSHSHAQHYGVSPKRGHEGVRSELH